MKINIFFDLDGTLIDSRKRLYNLFQFLVPQSDFSIEDYWNLKRNKINHRMILEKQFNYSENDVKLFENKWLDLIEMPEYLEMDTVYEETISMLEKLYKNHNLYIITARQSKQNVISQLEDLKLIKYFKKNLVTENKITKIELIKNNCKINSHDIIIGDTGNDILVGKTLGLKTIAVDYGFISKEKIEEYKPNFIVSNLTQVQKIINEKVWK